MANNNNLIQMKQPEDIGSQEQQLRQKQKALLGALTPTAKETQLGQQIAALQTGQERGVARLGETAAPRGITLGLLRGQQEKLQRQAGIEIGGFQRQLGLEQQARGLEQQRAGTELGFLERGLERAEARRAPLLAEQRAIRGEERAETRQIAGEARAVERQTQQQQVQQQQQQQQFEQSLALQGFNKIASPDQLAGLTEEQIQRIPNPVTGQVDIFRKPPDDNLLSVSEAQTLGLPFGTTVKQAAAQGIVPRKTTSGGTSLGFIPTDIVASSETPPTFEEFIQEKQQEMRTTLTEEGREQFRGEYIQLVRDIEQNSTQAINIRMENRIKNLPLNQRENARTQVTNLLNQGFVEEANNFIDGLGGNLGNTQTTDLTQARLAKKNITRIDALINKLGARGPVIGRIRQLNPFDPDIVELNNLITQTVPGLARGIFKEVGVLTDTDVDRYTATIANPNLTVEQAERATKQLLQTINSSIQIQLDTLDKAGKNVAEFKDLLEEVTGALPEEAEQPTGTAEAILGEFGIQ